MSYAAAVIEVQVGKNGEIAIPRVDMAFDCGPQVNPDRIRAQLEGACIMGLTLAKYGEITFKDGRVQQSNFSDLPLMRISEAPREIRLHLLPASFDVPLGGVGEPATAADRAGALQCHLRRNRPAHPAAADQGSVGASLNRGSTKL